jgi:hypothetical protein
MYSPFSNSHGILDSAGDVKQVALFTEAALWMTQRGIEGTPDFVILAPDDRVMDTVGTSCVRLLIDGDEYVKIVSDITKVVPLISVNPR